jgi:hypothetical protein
MMADHPADNPPAKDTRARDQQARRLAAALRENLKRRKQQARGRAAEPVASPQENARADDSSAS